MDIIAILGIITLAIIFVVDAIKVVQICKEIKRKRQKDSSSLNNVWLFLSLKKYSKYSKCNPQ